MDKNKKLLIIGGSVGATALVALVIISIALANRPGALIVRAFANTIDDAKRIEVYDVAEDVINGGSIAVSANLEKFANDDVTVQAKLYTDAKNVKGAGELKLSEDDETVLQTSVFLNQDKAAMKCPEFFDGTYGINFKKLSKNLPGSIFDPDEETDYSFDDEQYEYFMNLQDTVKKDRNLQDDFEKLAAQYRLVFIEKLMKYSSVSKSGKTITVAGEKIPCTVVTVSVDEEAAVLIAQAMIDYANNDEVLEKYLYRVASNGALYDDPDEYVDEFYDYLDELGDDIEDLADEDLEISLDFFITRSGRRLARLDADLEYGKEDMEFSVVLGKNVSKSKEISLTAKDKQSGESYCITYKVSEDSSKLYKAELEIEERNRSYRYYDYDDYDYYDYDDKDSEEYINTTKTTIKVEWDKKKGDLVVKYEDKWDDTVIKGSLLEKGDKYIFVLTNIREDGEAVPDIKSLELTITLDRHDPAPNVPGNFTEITKMSERDFKHLSEDIEDGIEDIWDEYFDMW